MAGKKGAPPKALQHPNSRGVRQLERRTRREERLSEREKRQHSHELLEATRFFWFREQCLALGRSRSAFSAEEVGALIHIYLGRNDAELSSLRSLRAPPAGRIKKIEALKAAEAAEFESSKGIAVPDISDKDHVEILTEIWDGRADTLRLVPRRRVARKAAAAPPGLVGKLEARLKPIEEIRETAAAAAPRRVQKFQAQSRAQSVKKCIKPDEVAQRSKQRGVEQQQKRLKKERAKLLASSRGA
ncbi:hypothetical protein TraAM80_09160 [Trypanosoma rangeli]|uniref:Translation machinery-associated protein 16 n=1 Tax=Trypanosoma rangeli TaxID=5698 RepID=A0A422MX73_TRYRA|nr:uncharacterized protein TraAM80_09160 [Trypanosoma rangeli]RNE97779.1 hypothetical protein TraAM80_09160 [Trypanosoma rangeli]|eukprot:RNE97779.1 hypothetical protein TraAM80_09160 [Trypanosoma rangeli]